MRITGNFGSPAPEAVFLELYAPFLDNEPVVTDTAGMVDRGAGGLRKGVKSKKARASASHIAVSPVSRAPRPLSEGSLPTPNPLRGIEFEEVDEPTSVEEESKQADSPSHRGLGSSLTVTYAFKGFNSRSLSIPDSSSASESKSASTVVSLQPMAWDPRLLRFQHVVAVIYSCKGVGLRDRKNAKPLGQVCIPVAPAIDASYLALLRAYQQKVHALGAKHKDRRRTSPNIAAAPTKGMFASDSGPAARELEALLSDPVLSRALEAELAREPWPWAYNSDGTCVALDSKGDTFDLPVEANGQAVAKLQGRIALAPSSSVPASAADSLRVLASHWSFTLKMTDPTPSKASRSLSTSGPAADADKSPIGLQRADRVARALNGPGKKADRRSSTGSLLHLTPFRKASSVAPDVDDTEDIVTNVRSMPSKSGLGSISEDAPAEGEEKEEKAEEQRTSTASEALAPPAIAPPPRPQRPPPKPPGSSPIKPTKKAAVTPPPPSPKPPAPSPPPLKSEERVIGGTDGVPLPPPKLPPPPKTPTTATTSSGEVVPPPPPPPPPPSSSTPAQVTPVTPTIPPPPPKQRAGEQTSTKPPPPAATNTPPAAKAPPSVEHPTLATPPPPPLPPSEKAAETINEATTPPSETQKEKVSMKPSTPAATTISEPPSPQQKAPSSPVPSSPTAPHASTAEPEVAEKRSLARPAGEPSEQQTVRAESIAAEPMPEKTSSSPRASTTTTDTLSPLPKHQVEKARGTTAANTEVKGEDPESDKSKPRENSSTEEDDSVIQLGVPAKTSRNPGAELGSLLFGGRRRPSVRGTTLAQRIAQFDKKKKKKQG